MTTRSPAVARAHRLAGARRKAVLTVHLVAAVALLGASIVLLVTGLYAATRDDPREAHAIYSLLRLLTFSLDVPLAFIALAGGALLALTSKWGIFRHWWVTTKLAILLTTHRPRGHPHRSQHQHDARRHRNQQPERQQRALETGRRRKRAGHVAAWSRHARRLQTRGTSGGRASRDVRRLIDPPRRLPARALTTSTRGAVRAALQKQAADLPRQRLDELLEALATAGKSVKRTTIDL
jgi:hypothetical protein